MTEREYDHALKSDQRYNFAQRTSDRSGDAFGQLNGFHQRSYSSWWIVAIAMVLVALATWGLNIR